MENTTAINKQVKRVYKRFLNGADVWTHRVRHGGRIERQRISDFDIRSVKDTDGTAHVFLDEPIQYEALITAVLVVTGVYKFYLPALENALQTGDRLAACNCLYDNKATQGRLVARGPAESE